MRPCLVVLLLLCSVEIGRAQHHHEVDRVRGDETSAFAAAMSLVAATYETMLYAGNYEGVVTSFGWIDTRFAAGVTAAAYRVEKNGATTVGIGDVVLHGQAALIGVAGTSAGIAASVSLPTGDNTKGLGMGHIMLMPAAFGMWSIDRVALSVTAGYSRALAADDHDHGMWPLVEPMNPSEITWSVGGDVAIAHSVQAGARFSGGIPIGGGENRIVTAVRAMWHRGRFSTAAEVQAGLDGDPFIIRGVVSTALSF